jgi:hypothetical protein
MGRQLVEDVGTGKTRQKKSWIRFRASRIAIWATNFGGNSGIMIMSNPMKTREKVVGAKGFEPSTSWSRTREAKILKPCRCRTYDPSGSQNLPQLVHMVHRPKVC